MNKFLIMMNQMNPMYLFSGCGENICFAREKWQKELLFLKKALRMLRTKQILIKHVEMGFIWFIWYIIFNRKLINILNKYQLTHNNDEPMNPDVLRGAYGLFLHCLKKEVFWKLKMGQKMVFFEGQTTSRYIGSSVTPAVQTSATTRVTDTADSGSKPPRLASREEK